jgi:hypothetical protein
VRLPYSKQKALRSSRPHLHSARIISLWYIDHHDSPTRIASLTLKNKAIKMKGLPQ